MILRVLAICILLHLPIWLFGQGESPDSSRRDMYGWTVQTLKHSSLRKLPIRGIENYLPLLTGIAEVNGNLHFRGSRGGEVAYFLDGFSVTNPFFNSNGIPLIPEAIKELQVHTGAYGPLLGNANGGVVVTQLRTGGDSLSASLDYQTDEFAKPGREFLRTTAQGYRNIVGTVGGPLPLLGMKFFVAGQHSFMRNRQPMFLEPFRYDGLVTDDFGSNPAGIPLPGTVRFKRNYIDQNWLSSTIVQGNTTVDLEPVHLKFTGSYSFEESPEESNWPSRMRNYYRQKRSLMNEATTKFGGVQAFMRLDDRTEVRASVSLYNRFARQYDPDFGDEWQLYSDSVASARLGYGGFVSRYWARPSYTTVLQFIFSHPDAPNNSYSKNEQSGFVVSINAKHQMLPFWTVTLAGTYERWTMRSYRIGNISNYFSSVDWNQDGIPDRIFQDENDRRISLSRSGNITNYGYDYLGNELNDGLDAARRPLFASLAINNEIVDDQVSLNVGGIYKVLSSDILSVSNYVDPTMDYTYGIVVEKEFTRQEPVRLFLPRLSATYKLSQNMTASVAYGAFAQYTAFQNLYLSQLATESRIRPYYRVPYWLGGPVVSMFAQPERSTVYEFGISNSFGESGGVSVRIFAKSLKNQLEPGRIYNDEGRTIFIALLNKGQGEVKGVELSAQLNPSKTFSVAAFYTFMRARGTTSHPFGLRREMSDITLPPVPFQLFPLDYDQTHQGSLLATLFFDEEHGAVLEGLNVTGLLSFNSGHRYTKVEELRYLGAAGPWNIGVRQIIDPRFSTPVELSNASSTPWVFNIDVQISKTFSFSFVTCELYINVLNLLNTKHVLNLYPTTGTPTDDSWLQSQYAEPYTRIPLYQEFYRTINLENRWAYTGATGYDIYGKPRQIRAGVRIMM